MTPTRCLPIVLAIACTAPVERGVDRTPEVPGTGALLIASTDYEVGTIALFDPASGTLTDGLALTGGDPQVRVVDGLALVIDRFSGDGLRLYDPEDWTTPLASVPLDGAANVHDVAAWDGRLVATQYERPELLVFDHDGLIHGTVDLSAHADGDGIPEASGLQVTPDGLRVGLQRLDRDSGWVDAGGRVVTVAADGAVRPLTDLGPSPRLFDDGAVVTGTYFTADGALRMLDADGVPSPPVLEETGHDFGAYAAVDGYGVLTGVALDAPVDEARVWCVDWRTGAVVDGPGWTGVWAAAASAGPDGGVWLALRTGWSTGDAPEAQEPSVVRIDPDACEVTDTLVLDLEPYDVARL